MLFINRREIKIYIPENLEKYFISWLSSKFCIIKSYPKRTIHSLYFDTNNYKSALDNIIGISKRRKYRFRWYGNSKDTFGYFEIKNKNNILSKKETYQLNVKVKNIDFKRMLDLNSFEFNSLNEKLKKKIIGIKLFPNLFVEYDRSYYKFHNLDLTLDSNLHFTQYGGLEKKKTKNCLIFEIKFNIKFENEINLLLNDLDLAISRNSKYLQGLDSINKFSYV
jgi:hypothetical protein